MAKEVQIDDVLKELRAIIGQLNVDIAVLRATVEAQKQPPATE